MENEEELVGLDHCVLHLATYAKDPMNEKRDFPDMVFHKPVAASVICFREEEDDQFSVEAQNFLSKKVDGEENLVRQLVEYLDELSPTVLVTFFGHGFTLPVLYYRCFIHSIAAPVLFNPETGFYPKHAVNHLELTNILTNYGSLPAKKMSYYNQRLLGLRERSPEKVIELADSGKWGRIKGNLAVDTFCMGLLFLRHAVVTGLVLEDREDEVTGLLVDACSKSKAVRALADSVFEDAEEAES